MERKSVNKRGADLQSNSLGMACEASHLSGSVSRQNFVRARSPFNRLRALYRYCSEEDVGVEFVKLV